FRTRILLVVAARLELKRINKNADGDLAIFASNLTRHANQLAMRLVQRAHRRYEHTPFSTRLRSCICDGAHDFHASSFTQFRPVANCKIERFTHIRSQGPQKRRVARVRTLKASRKRTGCIEHFACSALECDASSHRFSDVTLTKRCTLAIKRAG